MKKLNLLVALLLLVSMPLYFSGCQTIYPVNATSNPVGAKVGMSEGVIYLGVLAFNVDASIKTAAKNGGITHISTVDFKTYDIMHIYTKVTCIVTGD